MAGIWPDDSAGERHRCRRFDSGRVTTVRPTTKDRPVPLIRDTPAGELSPYLEQHRDNPAYRKGGALLGP